MSETDRNKASRKQKNTTALLQSEKRFRTAFQTSADAVALIRLEDNRLIDVNAGFALLTGYSREEAVGKSTETIDLWQERGYQAKLTSLLKNGESILNMETVFRHRQGLIKSGLISAMLITQDAQPHLLLVIRDIDVLKKAEEALAVSEARFRELFNNMSSGVAVYRIRDDGSLILVDCNRAAESIEAVNKEEMLQKDVQHVFSDFRHGNLASVIKRVWATGESARYPMSIFHRQTLLSWKEYYIYKLPSGEIITVFDDVTERKIAEEKLLQYQEKLRILTAELSLAEERERRAIATELHDQIGQTLSVLSMKLYDLHEKMTTPDLAQQVEEIQADLKRIIQDTRSLTFELSPPVLYELGLEAALEWLSEQFQKQHGLRYRFENDGLPKPLTDDVRIVLFRAVRELLINVVKHARSDQVRIAVLSRDGNIRITVEDTGMGFDPQRTTQSTKVYGFGLFNIRERLNHLGGYLQIDASPGQGACITITAPLDAG